MSMTSKVNPTLREEIVDYLAGNGYGTSNLAFVYQFNSRYSLRTIQEATQKMTKDGTLIATREFGFVYYKLNQTIPVRTSAATGLSLQSRSG